MSDLAQCEVARRCTVAEAFNPQLNGTYKIVAKCTNCTETHFHFRSVEGRDFSILYDDSFSIQPNFWYELVIELNDAPRDVLTLQLSVPFGENFNDEKYTKFLQLYVEDPVFFQPENNSRLYADIRH